MVKKFKSNRSLEDIKFDVLRAKGEWRDDNFKNGSDHIGFSYEGKEVERFITEKDVKMDGTAWYDRLLNLLYEPLSMKKAKA